MRKLLLGMLSIALCSLSVGCGGGDPEGVAQDFVSAYQDADLAAMRDMTASPEIRDKITLFLEEVEDEDDRRELLFEDKDNSIYGVEMVSVEHDSNTREATVSFAFYLDDKEQDEAGDRVEYKDGKEESIWEGMAIQLGLVDGTWKVLRASSTLRIKEGDDAGKSLDLKAVLERKLTEDD